MNQLSFFLGLSADGSTRLDEWQTHLVVLVDAHRIHLLLLALFLVRVDISSFRSHVVVVLILDLLAKMGSVSRLRGDLMVIERDKRLMSIVAYNPNPFAF